MMKIVIRGGAGSGKTRTMIQFAIKEIEEKGIENVYYTGFTKNSVNEATKRLVESGYDENEVSFQVRTLHSTCYKLLGLSWGSTVDFSFYTEYAKRIFSKYNINLPHAKYDFCSDETSTDYIESDTAKMLTLYNLLRNKYLTDINTITESRLRSIMLEEKISFNMNIIHQNIYALLQELRNLKKEKGVYDYGDMLFEVYLKKLKPESRVFFFDEFQDFTKLQYEIYKIFIQGAEMVYVAGDELQAIFMYMGGSSEYFMSEYEFADRQLLIKETYRLPQRNIDYIWKVLNHNHIRRIMIEPPISKAEVVGEVYLRQHSDVEDILSIIEHLKGEKVCVLARSNYLKDIVKRELNIRGYVFNDWGKGDKYWSSDLVLLYNGLLRFVNDRTMYGREIEAVLRNSYARGFLRRGTQKKFKGEEITFGAGLLSKSEISEYVDIMTYTYSFLDMLGMLKITDVQRECMERRYYSPEGKNYIGDINLTLSTIHAYKGSEIDNIIYIANITKKIFERSTRQQEGIIAYVAMTRAKKRLYIMDMTDHERNMIIFPVVDKYAG